MLLSAEKDGREVAPHAHYQRHGCYLAAWVPLATGGRASAKESRHTGNLSSPCVLSLSGEPELPRWLSSKECACQCRRRRRRGFHPWEGKSPWRRKWQPTTLFLPGWSHGQESGGLQSMGSQRVGQDWARNTHSGGARLLPPPAAGVVHVRDWSRSYLKTVLPFFMKTQHYGKNWTTCTWWGERGGSEDTERERKKIIKMF